MSTHIASLWRMFSWILGRNSNRLSSPHHKTDSNMSSYTCTVSVQAGKAPEDAKAHHVNDKTGRLVSFQNPTPSYGIFRNMPLIQGLSMYFRYVGPVARDLKAAYIKS